MRRNWWGVVLLLVVCLSARAEEVRPLTREEAVTLALRDHPAVVEAESRARAAGAVVDRTRAPQHLQMKVDSRVSATSEVSTIEPVSGLRFTLGEKENWSSLVGASHVIYSGGRLDALETQAARQAQAARVTVERVRQTVAFEAERAYLLLATAQRDRAVTQEALNTAEEHLQVVQAKFDARTAAKYDVLRAEVQVEEAKQDVIRADAGIATAHASLLRALGLQQGAFTTADDLPTPAPVAAEATLLARALASRPELRALARQQQAARAGETAARAEKRPTVGLSLDYQYAVPETPLQISRWTLGAVATMPILDGGLSRAKVQEARAQQAQVTAATESQRNAIAMEVAQAHARVRAAEAQIAVAQKRVEQTTELLRVAKVRNEAGIGTAVEFADAQTSAARAKQGLVRALADWGVAAAELRLAVGSPEIAASPATEVAAP